MARLRLFGGASIEDDSGPLEGPPAQRHRLALLALLAIHLPAAVPRSRLWGLLWPDRGTAAARNLLNQAVHQLRKALGPRTIRTLGNALLLDAERLDCDVLAFRDALENQGPDRAVELRTGPFLAGFSLPDAPAFERWVTREREKLDRAYATALETVAAEEAAAGDHRAAAALWRLRLDLDPLAERTVLGLMRALASAGDRAGALHEAEAYIRRLAEELRMTPDPEVVALADRLRTREPAPPAIDARASPEVAPVLAGTDERAGADETVASRGRLIGRATEWDRLRSAWRTAARGRAGFALLAGEAGIGKTRLAEELLAWAARRGVLTASARSYAAEGRLAFGPVADWLRSEGLRNSLDSLEADWRADLALLAPELADVDAPGPSEARPGDWARQRLFRALARAVLGRGEPRLLLIDDLQWCDPDTLEWLHFLLRFDPAAPLLVVGASRLDEVGSSHPLRTLLRALERQEDFDLVRIPLDPLGFDDSVALGEVEVGRTMDEGEKKRLFRETEGHPLFVVEWIRAGRLGGDETDDGQEALPGRMSSVIRSRLARLSPPARQVAGVAATVGRDFPPELVAGASELPPAIVADALDELVDRRIVREAGDALDFTHDKLREVVYADLGTLRRRLIHRRVAEAIEAGSRDDPESVAGALAGHWEKAGKPVEAIACYRVAAERARAVHGHADAAGYLDRALRLLAEGAVADRERRARLELALESERGDSLLRVRGWAAPEAARAHERELALAERLGDRQATCRALWGLQSVFMVRAELGEAREFGERLLRLAEELGNPVFVAAGRFSIGLVCYLVGEFERSARQIERGIAAHQASGPDAGPPAIREQAGILLPCSSSLLAWQLGDDQRALEREREARELAERLDSPFARTAALVYGALLHQHRDDRIRARERASGAIALADEFALPHYRHTARVIHGWAQVREGHRREGSREIASAIEDYAAIGSRLRLPYFLGLQARADRLGGAFDQALKRVDRALELCASTGERWPEAELLHLKAVLLEDRDSDSEEPAALRRRAIAVARRQGAVAILARFRSDRGWRA